MSWKASCVMDERLKFVAECLKEEASMTELCEEYGISRKTGYKWLRRYEAVGPEGLRDLSRAPHRNPRAVDEVTVQLILDRRDAYEQEGPSKIRTALMRNHPERTWPAASTIGEILKDHGRIERRRRPRPRSWPSSSVTPLSTYGSPNAAWSADFKGWFYTRDGYKCNPLTVEDAWSRFALGCFALGARTGYLQVQPRLETLFREFGLPQAIRTDNGPPFGSVGLASLSPLSVWFMQLGIHPDHTRPAKPQDNGRHERFHRTLKEATATPPQATLRKQQRAFDEFLEYYNYDRSHQALEQKLPADFYTPSPRPYPRKVTEPEYSREWTVRKVKHRGGIMWDGTEVYLTQALAGHHVGFKPIEDDCWLVYFYCTPIAIFDEPDKAIRPLPKERPI